MNESSRSTFWTAFGILRVLDFYYSQIDNDVNTVLASDGICENKLNILLSVEGGDLLDGKIERLYKLYDLGIRSMTLTWNGDNCIGWNSKQR